MNFERTPGNSFLPRNNKEHVGRIRWDYFQFARRAPLSRWKFRIALLALLLVVVPTTAYFLAPRFVDGKSSPGTVHHVHSTWNMTCDACHVPNRSVDSLTTGKWNEFKCQECHAGPAHHESAKMTAKQSCASCHRDHQGPDSAMTRSPDTDCTQCHANLIESYKDEYKAVAVGRWENKITAFHVDHPEFKVVGATAAGTLDPAKHRSLKFNHAVHMTPGQPSVEGGSPFVIGDIKDPEEQKRYRWITAQVLGKPVGDIDIKTPTALNCAACHALDASQQQPAMEVVFPNPSGIRPLALSGTDKPFDLTKSVGNLPTQPLLPPRQKGEYFLASVFEQHCKACHPLNLGSDADLANQSVPHGLTAKDTDTFLDRAFSQRIAKNLPSAGAPARRTSRLDPRLDFDAPAKETGGGASEEDKKKVATLGTEIRAAVELAKTRLYTHGTGCIKCHEIESEAGKEVQVKPGRAPVVWMEHSRFNHTSHNAMACVHCHQKAYEKLPPPDVKLVEKGPLDLPGIENCKQCHMPTKVTNGVRTGGVRSNCTDCHTYHNGDHALAGPGDPSRGPQGGRTWTVPDLLRGSRTE